MCTVYSECFAILWARRDDILSFRSFSEVIRRAKNKKQTMGVMIRVRVQLSLELLRIHAVNRFYFSPLPRLLYKGSDAGLNKKGWLRVVFTLEVQIEETLAILPQYEGLCAASCSKRHFSLLKERDGCVAMFYAQLKKYKS